MKIEVALTAYLNENKCIKGLSENTIKCQEYIINEYYKTLKIVNIEEMNSIMIQKYIDKLRAKGLSKATIRSRYCALMAFVNHYYKTGIIKFNPYYHVRKVRKYRAHKIPLRADEMQKMVTVKCRHAMKIEYQHKRNRAIIGLFIYAGMRVGEIIRLTLEDVSASSGYIRVINGKFNIDRVVPIAEPLTTWLKEYEEVRLKCRADYYFIGLFDKTKMERNSITRIIKRYAKTAGIRRNVCSHILRHSFASQMLKGKVDMEKLRIIMGHSNVEMTAVYAKPDFAMIKEALMKSPLVEYFGGKT
ncbi:MAG: tyrosine-type recombinase/integrase [Candidatus Margulisiibacteriota bacterium]